MLTMVLIEVDLRLNKTTWLPIVRFNTIVLKYNKPNIINNIIPHFPPLTNVLKGSQVQLR